LRSRLLNRLDEMKERRRRLIKYMYKKDDKLAQFESDYPTTVAQKHEITGKFSVVQLEELLLNSTKNVAHEVVMCLIAK
jgi:hypothetical protein